MRNMGTVRALVTILTPFMLALGGCATMNANECRTVDWRTIGYEDGVAGRSGEQIAQHRKACAKFGVSPNFSLYQTGREQGLREFCKPANAFWLGTGGGSYAGVCPAELEDAFTHAYASGHQLFTLRARVSNSASQLEAERRELDHVEQQLARKTAAVVGSETSVDDRTQALLETKQLAERAGRIKADIRQLERDKAHYEIELENYRETLASNR